MIYVLSFRANKRTGGPVVPGRLESGPDLGTKESLQMASKVTVLLHGFNVDYKTGRATLLRFAKLLPSAANGAVIAALWPGDHGLGALSYSFEGRDADDTALELARFLGDVLMPTVSIAFVAHSLGCRVAMETAARLVAQGHTPEQICLLAAAIDDDSLAATDAYLAATDNSARVAALSSRQDKVLKLAYPVGDLLQAFLFADDTADLALGYHGARPHKRSGTAVPENVLDERIPKRKSRRDRVGHGDYLPSQQTNQKQRAAARFADAVLAGVEDPRYG